MNSLKSLETLALEAMPNDAFFQFLYMYYHAPIAKMYLPKFLERCAVEDMERLSRTIPWDHPLAREMDFTVHKRRMKGKTTLFCSPLFLKTGSNPNFFLFIDRQTGCLQSIYI